MPKIINKFLITIALIINISLNVEADNKIEHKIAVLVNENAITSYDIVQRLKLTAIISGKNVNSQFEQFTINKTIDELIQEKIKLDKINEYKIDIDDIEYFEFENNFFQRQNVDRSQALQLLKENNVSYRELKDLLTIELSWSKLISGLYYRFTSVSKIEIDEMISKNPGISQNQAENYIVQRQLDLQSSKLLRDISNEATIEYK